MTPYYADDHATLYHGNWRDFQDEWAGTHVDLLLTDPPYGRNWRQGGLKGARRPGGSTGSGSILVAAKLAGRQAVGVEIEERYCEIAARRLAQDVLNFGDAS